MHTHFFESNNSKIKQQIKIRTQSSPISLLGKINLEKKRQEVCLFLIFYFLWKKNSTS